MIAFQVTSKTGQVMAFFRHESDARDYFEKHKDRREPIFRAVEIITIQMSEGLWDPWFTPLTDDKLPLQ